MSLSTYKPDLTLLEQYSSALVLGLGATGYSVVRYLRKHGVRVTVADTRSTPPLMAELIADYPEVQYVFGSFDDIDIADHTLIVASPGLDLRLPQIKAARNRGAHIIGDIELFIEANQRPLIAITGSNGKSTVTSLVGHMCAAGGLQPWVAGNIGVPALDALTDDVAYDVAVLELSSFQLETTSTVAADSATILNISADHLDRYESMGDYVLAKARVLRGAKQAVLPRHDERLRQITNVAEPLSFALDEPANDSEYGLRRINKLRWLVRGEQRLIKVRDIPLLGMHNLENVLAAFALVDFLHLPIDKIVAAAHTFNGLAHRMQTVAEVAGVTWVNDSKATNIGAATTALNSVEQDVIWIAGGQGKDADFAELRSNLNSRIKLLILLGEDAPKIRTALEDLLPIEMVENMQQAVTTAARHAKPGTIVLLSPACASFDMYRSFQQRGEDFIAQVQAYTSSLEHTAA